MKKDCDLYSVPPTTLFLFFFAIKLGHGGVLCDIEFVIKKKQRSSYMLVFLLGHHEVFQI